MQQTIPALMSAAAQRFGAETAIVDGEVRLTFAGLDDAARTLGAALIASGVEPGDRVAIWAPNSVEWVVAYLGLSLSGAALVPINTRFKGREAAEVLRRGGVRALVTTTDFLGTDYLAELRSSGIELPALELIVAVGGGSADGAVPWANMLGRASAESLEELDRRRAAVEETDVADILFTSGTTGTPKGVVQTHGSSVRVASDWVAMTSLSSNDRYLMVNPYFHMFGLKAGILASITAGATMLPEPVFDVGRVLQRITDEAVTVLPGAPTIYQSILGHRGLEDHDLSSLRVAVTGAAEIPVELIRRVLAELPFEIVIAGYGLTEGGTATATVIGDDPETIATTVGRPRPGFELRLVDADGLDVADGGSGEVLLRSATVMSHYLDDPVATAAAISAEGWLRTGDIGTLDPAGNLRIVGRAKDMFIVGGFNVYPAEIENTLGRHPAIAESAVIGIPDDRLGEVGMAFVVLRPGASASPDEIVAWSRVQMANYKVPRQVELVDELPRNATGKIVKQQLRDRATP